MSVVTRTELCGNFLGAVPRFVNGTLSACDSGGDAGDWAAVAGLYLERASCVCPRFVDQLEIPDEYQTCIPDDVQAPDLSCATDSLTDFHACFVGIEGCIREGDEVGTLQHLVNCYNDHRSAQSLQCGELEYDIDVGPDRSEGNDDQEGDDQEEGDDDQTEGERGAEGDDRDFDEDFAPDTEPPMDGDGEPPLVGDGEPPQDGEGDQEPDGDDNGEDEPSRAGGLKKLLTMTMVTMMLLA